MLVGVQQRGRKVRAGLNFVASNAVARVDIIARESDFRSLLLFISYVAGTKINRNQEGNVSCTRIDRHIVYIQYTVSEQEECAACKSSSFPATLELM